MNVAFAAEIRSLLKVRVSHQSEAQKTVMMQHSTTRESITVPGRTPDKASYAFSTWPGQSAG
jgi:hypothetical protein